MNSAYEISIPIAPPPMDPFSVTTADLPNSVFLSYNDSSTHSCKSRICLTYRLTVFNGSTGDKATNEITRPMLYTQMHTRVLLVKEGYAHETRSVLDFLIFTDIRGTKTLTLK